MPTIYLRKDLYDALIKSGKDPNAYVNSTIEAALKLAAMAGTRKEEEETEHAEKD